MQLGLQFASSTERYETVPILIIPVPLWLLVVVIVVGAFFIGLQQRIGHLERVINNMDRWADGIDERLDKCAKSSSHS